MKQTLRLHARYTGATSHTSQTGALFRVRQNRRRLPEVIQVNQTSKQD